MTHYHSVLISMFFLIVATDAMMAGSPSPGPNAVDFKNAAMGPMPHYPSDMKNHRIGGSGVFVLHVDVKTGSVRDVEVEKSTRVNELDTSAVLALRQWRFVPYTVADKVRVPIAFSPGSPPKIK